MPDVNVLVAAFRTDLDMHEQARSWLEDTLESEFLAVSSLVATGFVRVITNRRIFRAPDSLELALAKLKSVIDQEKVLFVNPGQKFWNEFEILAIDGGAVANLVSDAAHAAVAIEHGATWVTYDKNFSRFSKLQLELLK